MSGASCRSTVVPGLLKKLIGRVDTEASKFEFEKEYIQYISMFTFFQKPFLVNVLLGPIH